MWIYLNESIYLRSCLRSSMDRILVSGTNDMSSNLVGDTDKMIKPPLFN